MRMIGLDAEAVFTHPRIVAWRKLPDRENCTLDAEGVRLHIKRYASADAAPSEVAGIELLQQANISTIPLVGYGNVADGRSFLITEELDGYRGADKLIASGLPFASLLDSTANLAAKLHRTGLHHRDLYLCHFFAREDGSDVHLVDAARVARFGSVFTRRRWIVKALAQFWYSMMPLPLAAEQRDQWLSLYGAPEL